MAAIIPPPKSAVPGLNDQRNARIRRIAETGYDFRALIEAQISRWKATIGDGLTARTIDTQTTETCIAAKLPNRMTDLGRAKCARV